jgi:hypothetical protein
MLRMMKAFAVSWLRPFWRAGMREKLGRRGRAQVAEAGHRNDPNAVLCQRAGKGTPEPDF